MTRLTIILEDEVKQALRSLSQAEFREPRAQAALIIFQELQRQGLIKSATLKEQDAAKTAKTAAPVKTILTKKK